MLIEDLSQITLLAEAIELFEKEDKESTQNIQQLAAKLPAFPGTELKKEVDVLIKSSADLLKQFANKAKPWALDRGYRTQIFDLMLDNPEKIAKNLIRKYTSAYKADGFVFNLRDVLKDIDLELKKA